MREEFVQRKATRLKDFDYSESGAYFITICTQGRRNILSSIVGEGSPLPQLSSYGIIADKWIKKIPEIFNDVYIDNYVIMPNHIHLLLSIINDGRGDPSPTVINAVGWLKYNITVDINKTRHIQKEKIFQRSFYDHIVRNRDDYDEIYKYIYENPICWQFDRLYAEE